MLSILSTTIEILLFFALFMMKSSFVLMNLIKLIIKDVIFFQKAASIYSLPFIKNVTM
jgi:hypothetical protein